METAAAGKDQAEEVAAEKDQADAEAELATAEEVETEEKEEKERKGLCTAAHNPVRRWVVCKKMSKSTQCRCISTTIHRRQIAARHRRRCRQVVQLTHRQPSAPRHRRTGCQPQPRCRWRRRW